MYVHYMYIKPNVHLFPIYLVQICHISNNENNKEI